MRNGANNAGRQAALVRAQRAAEPERAQRAAVLAWFKSLTPSQRVQVRAFCANCNTKNVVVRQTAALVLVEGVLASSLMRQSMQVPQVPQLSAV